MRGKFYKVDHESGRSYCSSLPLCFNMHSGWQDLLLVCHARH